MALNLESICTDGDLAARAGAARLNRAQPKLSERDGARAFALQEVVRALEGRSPPVREADLLDPTELRDAVRLRALQLVFEQAMSGEDGLFGQLAATFAREYASAAKRTYTLVDQVRSPGGSSFRMERR